MDTAARLLALKQKIQEVDRMRAAAEATAKTHQQQLAEVEAQIEALGVKPKDAEAELTKLEAALQGELAAIEQALQDEAAAYREITR